MTADTLPMGPVYPWLAPLAGYSDLPFRLLCREHGAAVACTEMISAKGIVYGHAGRGATTEALLSTTTQSCDSLLADMAATDTPDVPLVAQLFGAEAAYLERAVAILAERGFRWFDLNMGCPVPKVRKCGAGAAMLRDIPNALAAAKGMLRAAGPGKVGFKMRLGCRMAEDAYLQLAAALEDLGAGWITLHPRYAEQGFSGRADWNAFIPLVRRLSIPVIASGDLLTPEDGVRCIQETGVSGVMFARGAMANPAIFEEYAALLCGAAGQGGSGRVPPDARKVERIARRHAALARQYAELSHSVRNIPSGVLKMRSFLPRYVRHFSGARHLRQQLCRCTSWEDLESLLSGFFRTTGLLHAGTSSNQLHFDICCEEEKKGTP